MNRKMMVSVLSVVGLVLWGCSGLHEIKSPGYGDPPVITASFCVDKGMYGDSINPFCV
jgi:hypothetical protein